MLFTMFLHSSVKRENPCFAPNRSRKEFNVSPLGVMLAVVSLWIPVFVCSNYHNKVPETR